MDISALQSIISLLVLGITWLIVQPLRTSIDGLQKAIEELKEELKKEIHDHYEEFKDIRGKVDKGEVNIQENTKKINTLEKRFNNLCRDCKCYHKE